jgi:hypothetical protein
MEIIRKALYVLFWERVMSWPDDIGYGQGSEAIPARRLIVHILHALAAVGWHIYMSVDLSKKTLDKDSLFFKSGPPLQRYFFSISFNESDKVRIIDSPK